MTTPADLEKTLRVDSSDAYVQRGRGDDAQFSPGTVIAGRYRIASILGAGGMGEVYRAEDTKLGQTVALKFLPARLARDPLLLGHLHEEVRLGRQIAHPNVCRIYDIGEADGAHFLAMEYVDGEDLARLLTRIGRLSHDKAVDIARGIAAGLAAAHAKGILHRDLKPPNVMIDSRGEPRIMDFGLALDDGESDGTVSGTPAYMAPEQLAGEPATVQSDLYALGLVMYELFTGKAAHNARTMPERLRDITSDITTPSSLVRDIEPAVERIILRCLANDPAARPRSAREVITALPGGDPLKAALAAGETPSPRLVAAAGAAGSLRPWVASTLLGIILASLGFVIAYRHTSSTYAYAPVERHPEVLSDHAAGMLRRFGIPRQNFTSRTFELNAPYIAWMFRNVRSPDGWSRFRRGLPPLTFRYQEAATPPAHGVARDAAIGPGTTVVSLDRHGQLIRLDALPERDWPARPVDWAPLLVAAGLDARSLSPATPTLVPRGPADTRAAWTGRHPEDGTPIRVEAATWRGTPAFFRVTGPWDSANTAMPFANRSTELFVHAFTVSVLALGVFLAWRNLRARRGDRQAAFRAAIAIFLLELVARLLQAEHHVEREHAIAVLQRSIADALLWAAVVYVLYLALEPFVRRHWPDHLIASTRLLSGNVRDPMVGRDVLIGLLGGLGHCALIYLPGYVGSGPGMPFAGHPDNITSPRFQLGKIAQALSDGAVQGFMMIIILVVMAIVLRKRALAVVGLGAVMMAGYYAANGGITVASLLLTILVGGIAARYGLLALAVAQASFHAVFHTPQFVGGSWYTVTGLIPVAIVVAAAIWAFRSSLASESAFGAKAFDA